MGSCTRTAQYCTVLYCTVHLQAFGPKTQPNRKLTALNHPISSSALHRESIYERYLSAQFSWREDFLKREIAALPPADIPMGQTFDFGVLIGAQRYLGTGTRSTLRGMYYSVARKAVVMSNLASRVTLRCKHRDRAWRFMWVGTGESQKDTRKILREWERD